MKRPTVFSFWVFLVTWLLTTGLLMYVRHAAADEPWQLTPPSCYPIVSTLTGTLIDARPMMRDGTDAGVWWCDVPDGIEENYRIGEYGGICERCFRLAISSLRDLFQLDRVTFNRPATTDEFMQLVAKADRLYEPRCAYAGTGLTTQVLGKNLDGTIGPARTDAVGKTIRWYTKPNVPSCYQWIRSGSKRWCTVTGRTDTAGREIGPDSYVACRIELAPKQGWPQ